MTAVETSTRQQAHWATRAACDPNDDWALYPRDSHSHAPTAMVTARIRKLCGNCPILAECGAEGLQVRATERYGVWGGILWNGIGTPPRNILHPERPVPHTPTGSCTNCGGRATSDGALYCHPCRDARRREMQRDYDRYRRATAHRKASA